MADLVTAIREYKVKYRARPERAEGWAGELLEGLLAIADAVDPDALPPNACDCRNCIRQWVLELIADALGIEATDG